jgi:UDP-glucuronate 4-epimerase
MLSLSEHPVLVTGAAGFIGFHLTSKLLEKGVQVVGIDNLNDYYDVRLKKDRLEQLERHPDFSFQRLDLTDRVGMSTLFARHDFEVVVHLAAQAGVRYSLSHPHVYIDSNIQGFLNILEGCRSRRQIKHLVFASSSSVYGANTAQPFSVHQNVDHPLSLYAATKKANELMAHTYAHLYGIPATGLRFFTVYGPWGRPDMALFLFTRAMLSGHLIQVFNYGKMKRDFTYIDDIVQGILQVMARPPQPDAQWSGAYPDPGSSPGPYRIYNIGNNRPVELMEMIGVLEKCLGIEARKEYLPMQAGDVQSTYADIDDLTRLFGFKPKTTIHEGIPNFVRWYRAYYGKRMDGEEGLYTSVAV